MSEFTYDASNSDYLSLIHLNAMTLNLLDWCYLMLG